VLSERAGRKRGSCKCSSVQKRRALQRRHGIVLDDMPPGSAIVFDLVRRPEGYYVRTTFASMALKQFRNEKLIDKGINLVTAQGLLPLTLLEGYAFWYEKMGLVVEDKWNPLSSPAENDPDPGSWPSGLKDPSWTDCNAQ
jgi:hypothetical protein